MSVAVLYSMTAWPNAIGKKLTGRLYGASIVSRLAAALLNTDGW